LAKKKKIKIVALAGGVGGAKLAHGLAMVVPRKDLTVIVNTGDDFEHFGLSISPDLDTVCYTLAGLANPETGWGRVDESWHAFEQIEKLGGPSWFRLGDKDLATHLERTRLLQSGEPLHKITAGFCGAWGIKARVLPMTNQRVATIVDTDEGELDFQEYFVARHCQPKVKGFRFEGIENAAPAPGMLKAIQAADAVVICPSNPWVSIDPILNIPGVRAAVASRKVIAVSPIIGGEALKGPAAKMYRELGIRPSVEAVSKHYGDLLDGFVIDELDHELTKFLPHKILVTDTIMVDSAARHRLAEELIPFIEKM